MAASDGTDTLASETFTKLNAFHSLAVLFAAVDSHCQPTLGNFFCSGSGAGKNGSKNGEGLACISIISYSREFG
jgi:hypothetical protein